MRLTAPQHMTSDVSPLRAALQRITDPPLNSGLERLETQIKEIANLKTRYPHDIWLHTKFTCAMRELNCFMYALGMSADHVREKCDAGVFPGAKFVKWLVDSNVLLPAFSEVKTDTNLVIYFGQADCPTHAGWIQGVRVTSKWGSGCTHIWTHGIFEVPSGYGDCIGVFRLPVEGQAANAFSFWADGAIQS